MKRLAAPLALIISSIALTTSGCAAQRGAGSKPSAEPSSEHYIHAVNQQAVRRGFEVRWINPPRDD